MNQDPSLFILAGEPSGDRHGAAALKTLWTRYPNLFVSGVGGPALCTAGLDPVLPMEEFAVMGFSDVVKALPRLYRHFYTILNHILSHEFDVVLLIDYPGFNLKLAKALKKRGYQGKIIQYISPMVWAWGKERIQHMEKTLDQLLVIYPFESSYFEHSSLPVAYVGNPVSEAHSNYCYQLDWQKQVGLPTNQAPIALFPGSRAGEIKRNFPIQLEAVRRLQQLEPDLPIAISCASVEQESLIYHIALQAGLKSESWRVVPPQYTYELMASSELAIAKSGTVTLELALHGCPTVVTYVLTALNKCLARYWMKLNLQNYCIVNVLSQKEVFPELIKIPPTPKKILDYLYRLRASKDDCQMACREIKAHLSAKSASQEVAKHMERLWAN